MKRVALYVHYFSSLLWLLYLYLSRGGGEGGGYVCYMMIRRLCRYFTVVAFNAPPFPEEGRRTRGRQTLLFFSSIFWQNKVKKPGWAKTNVLFGDTFKFIAISFFPHIKDVSFLSFPVRRIPGFRQIEKNRPGFAGKNQFFFTEYCVALCTYHQRENRTGKKKILWNICMLHILVITPFSKWYDLT